jgi:hypothetical protein
MSSANGKVGPIVWTAHLTALTGCHTTLLMRDLLKHGTDMHDPTVLSLRYMACHVISSLPIRVVCKYMVRTYASKDYTPQKIVRMEFLIMVCRVPGPSNISTNHDMIEDGQDRVHRSFSRAEWLPGPEIFNPGWEKDRGHGIWKYPGKIRTMVFRTKRLPSVM